MSAIYLTKNRVYHGRTKHIDVRFHFVRKILDEDDPSWRRFTRRRLPSICLPRLFHKLSLSIARSYLISFQLLEFSGARLDELQMAWSLG